jgi:plastocyanin
MRYHAGVGRRRVMLAFVVAGMVAAVGGVSGLMSRPSFADDPKVAIDNFTFGPATLTVPVGTTVVWTNRDDIPHTVTSDQSPPLFRSKPLDTGDTFSNTFDKPGTYGYFCSLHPHMQGTVIVK